MDWGQIISVYSRLVLGAATAFLAILLWSKKRDTAWMLIAAGSLTAYAEIVHSVIELSGYTAPLVAALLPALRMVFFIIAFLIMVVRRKT